MVHMALPALLAAAAFLAQAAGEESDIPTVFEPGVISGGTHDAAPAFSPDRRRLYFSRSNPSGAAILEARSDRRHWQEPVLAPFSGTWNDLEPAFSPDGRYLIFVSNRPIDGSGKPLDGYFNGKTQPGQGGNLWRVDRTDTGWSKPVRLPDVINDGASVYAPSISANGAVTFMKPDPATKRFRLYHAMRRPDGNYDAPVPLPFSTGETTDVDPAMAPDESFLVFGSGRAPARSMDLFIVFKRDGRWGEPKHLGNDLNSEGSDAEPRLSPDLKTLYFSSERMIPQGFPRSRAEGAAAIAAANAWNNGLYNIWKVDLRPFTQPSRR